MSISWCSRQVLGEGRYGSVEKCELDSKEYAIKCFKVEEGAEREQMGRVLK